MFFLLLKKIDLISYLRTTCYIDTAKPKWTVQNHFSRESQINANQLKSCFKESLKICSYCWESKCWRTFWGELAGFSQQTDDSCVQLALLYSLLDNWYEVELLLYKFSLNQCYIHFYISLKTSCLVQTNADVSLIW